MEELKKEFAVSGVSKSPSIFDNQKLDYINSEYLRALSLDEFHEVALPWIRQTVKKDVDTKLIAKVLQARTEVLNQIPEQVDFVDELPEYDTALYVHKKMKTTEETSLEALNAALPVLEGLEVFTEETIHDAMFKLIADMGVKNGWMLWPLRVAVSGKQFTPGGGIEICAILGKEESLARIRKGIELLQK